MASPAGNMPAPTAPQLDETSSLSDADIDALFEESEDVASTEATGAHSSSPPPADDDDGEVYPAWPGELVRDEPGKERSQTPAPAPAAEQQQPRVAPEAPAQPHPAPAGYTQVAATAAAPSNDPFLTMEALQGQMTAPSPPRSTPRAPPTSWSYTGRDLTLPVTAYHTVLRAISMFDYQIPGDPVSEPVNFTAVEIIAFLPHWYQNYWVANRFMSNGIKGKTHQKILRTFRTDTIPRTTPEVGKGNFHLDGIRRCYKETMRGIRQNNPSHLASWTVGNHRVPQNWDHLDISVNNFQPDRVVRRDPFVPPAVHFTKLLKNVDHLPEGPDAADLTRALRFVKQNPTKIVQGQVQDWMFPDDLQSILQKTGRTQVTQEHSDKEVAERYPGDKDEPSQPRKKKKAAVVSVPQEADAPTNLAQEQDLGHAIPTGDAWQDMYLPPQFDIPDSLVNQSQPETRPGDPFAQSKVLPPSPYHPRDLQEFEPFDNQAYSPASPYLQNEGAHRSPQVAYRNPNGAGSTAGGNDDPAYRSVPAPYTGARQPSGHQVQQGRSVYTSSNRPHTPQNLGRQPQDNRPTSAVSQQMAGHQSQHNRSGTTGLHYATACQVKQNHPISAGPNQAPRVQAQQSPRAGATPNHAASFQTPVALQQKAPQQIPPQYQQLYVPGRASATRKRFRSDDAGDLPPEKRHVYAAGNAPYTINPLLPDPSLRGTYQDMSLVRNTQVPNPDDFSDYAQVIRFAQRPLQSLHDWHWNTQEVVQINQAIEREYIEQVNKILNAPPHDKSPLIRDFKYVSDVPRLSNEMFALSKAQTAVDWRYDAHHLRILAKQDLKNKDWDLQYWHRFVQEVEVCKPECTAKVE